ncbi:hypothetical protein KHA80_21025 [Anaerobacillus sp. HL2]|nr:hypothetical protein KHA80_21025 [Anaerobacillus sp. HL2]
MIWFLDQFQEAFIAHLREPRDWNCNSREKGKTYTNSVFVKMVKQRDVFLSAKEAKNF